MTTYAKIACLIVMTTGIACGPNETKPDVKEPATDLGASQPTTTFKQGLILNDVRACYNIIATFLSPQQYVLTIQDVQARFTLIKDLRSVSKSGAFPAIVRARENDKTRFLKVFSSIDTETTADKIIKSQSYLEIFNTCRLSVLSLHNNLPSNIAASIFFPKVFESGFFTAGDPFDTSAHNENSYYPFLLGEAIDNVTLTKLATDPSDTAKADSLGFTMATAPPMVLESILMQIMVALKNPYLAWGLTHNDLHPGNILLSINESADFSIEYDNKRLPLKGPLVKLIDFGLGQAIDFPQRASDVNIWVKNRPIIAELERFIHALRASHPISLPTRIGIYTASLNQDIVMFNLILRAMKEILVARGSAVPNGYYCKNYDDCIRLMSAWWQ